MKLISICLLVANPLLVTAYGGSKEQLPEFLDVRYEKESFVFTTHEAKWPLRAKVGKSGPLKTLVGKTDFEIPSDKETYFIMGRNQSLLVKDLGDQKGVSVARSTDLRSFNRGLKTESFSITVGNDGELEYGDVTTAMQYSGKGAEDKEDEARRLATREVAVEKKSPDEGLEGLETPSQDRFGQAAAADNERLEEDSARRSTWWVIGIPVFVVGMLLWRILKRVKK